MKIKILVADHDKESRDMIKALLSINNHEIIEACDGLEALANYQDADLVILDVLLPLKCCIRVCQEIRENSKVPIIFLASQWNEYEFINGLSAGGDDYIVRPYSSVEFLYRVQAILRRWYEYMPDKNDNSARESICIGNISLYDGACKAVAFGKEIKLTTIEYKILRLLCSEAGKVVSVQKIYEHIWGTPFLYSSQNTVMVHIRKLRMKIEHDPGSPRFIRTVWGSGYRVETIND